MLLSLRFKGHFPREPGYPVLVKLRMMEVVVTTEAISRAKLQSNYHHQQTNTQLFTGRMPFLSPNQQCQSTEGKNITFHGLVYPRSPLVFQLCFWPLIAPGYLGEGCHVSHQPSSASTPRQDRKSTNHLPLHKHRYTLILDLLHLCLVAPSGAQATDHFSPASSVLEQFV